MNSDAGRRDIQKKNHVCIIKVEVMRNVQNDNVFKKITLLEFCIIITTYLLDEAKEKTEG